MADSGRPCSRRVASGSTTTRSACETIASPLARCTRSTANSRQRTLSAAHAKQRSRASIPRNSGLRRRLATSRWTERLQTQAADAAARPQELGAAGRRRREPGNGRGSGSVEDEVLLRLQVYRSLGIEVERGEKDGEFNKAVVRNDRKGDVHVINIDRKFSRFFTRQLLLADTLTG